MSTDRTDNQLPSGDPRFARQRGLGALLAQRRGHRRRLSRSEQAGLWCGERTFTTAATRAESTRSIPGAVRSWGTYIYPSVLDVPDPVELAVLIVPVAATPGVMEACGKRGIRAAIVVSGGFRESGPEARELRPRSLPSPAVMACA